jgi:hypothetical protein
MQKMLDSRDKTVPAPCIDGRASGGGDAKLFIGGTPIIGGGGGTLVILLL